MRKLIRNPVKVRIERPNYKKFKVADLGINIIENPKRNNRKPKEYTIMETSLQQNPVYSKSRFAQQKTKEDLVKVMVFSQNISNVPYVCFSDGSAEACLPLEWQMTSSLLSRMIVKSGRRAQQVQDEIATGSSVIEIPIGDFNQIVKDADKYGKLFQKDREVETSVSTVSEVIECNTHTLRYLALALNIH